MRKPARQNGQRTKTAQPGSMLAPTGGWDAVSAIPAVPEDRAIILDNLVPRPGFLEFRRGSQAWVNGMPGPVPTLLAYRGSSPNRLFAACAGAIYEVTTQAVLNAPVFSGASSSTWAYVNFANSAGAFIRAVNGVDAPLLFDGTTWSTTSEAITGSSGGLTLNPNNLSAVMEHLSRLWFTEGASLRVWYLAPEAIGGAATLFDLGTVFQEGGSLIGLGVWTENGGNGPAAYACFFTSEGEVAVYGGTDPDQATSWGLVGVFRLGRPIGQRAIVRYGADLLVITSDGVVPLSQAVELDREASDKVALTARIQNAFATAVRSYKSNPGWQGILYGGGEAPTKFAQPGGSLAIFNIPVSGTTSWQFVQNMQTGAWCRFLGINALCWELCDEAIYFGAADGVYQWDVGATDDGAPITYDLKTAFSDFNFKGLKRFTMLRPLIKAAQEVQPALDVLCDYAERKPTGVPTVIGTNEGLWGDGGWGSAQWADPNAIRADWTSTTGLGYVGAVRMRVTVSAGDADTLGVGDASLDVLTSGDGYDIAVSDDSQIEIPVQIIGFDLMFQPGGML